MPEEKTPAPARVIHPEKYRQAAYGFIALNLIYLALVYVFLPPFNLGLLKTVSYTALFLALLVLLAYFIYQGSRILTLILAALYCARIILSVISLVSGEAFAAVPYVLPTTMITFYLLGRAVWNWP